jgi:hypothetical protein
VGGMVLALQNHGSDRMLAEVAKRGLGPWAIVPAAAVFGGAGMLLQSQKHGTPALQDFSSNREGSQGQSGVSGLWSSFLRPRR